MSQRSSSEPRNGSLRKTEFDWSTVFRRVHKLLIHPHTGDLVFTANDAGEILRFSMQRYLSNPGLCEKLNEDGYNPCIQSFKMPGYGKHEKGTVTTHSIDFDRLGNLWFTTQTNTCPLQPPVPGVGYIDRDWQAITMLDELQLPREPGLSAGPMADDEGNINCGSNGRPMWSFTGIAVDDWNTIWFTNFYQRQVHRLTLQPREPTN